MELTDGQDNTLPEIRLGDPGHPVQARRAGKQEDLPEQVKRLHEMM